MRCKEGVPINDLFELPLAALHEPTALCRFVNTCIHTTLAYQICQPSSLAYNTTYELHLCAARWWQFIGVVTNVLLTEQTELWLCRDWLE